MKIRVLPASEFDRLKELGDGAAPDSTRSVVIVAEQGEKLVGRIFLVAPTHLEGPFIIPELRGTTLLSRLVEESEKVATNMGITWMFAYAASRKLEEYLDRLGYDKSPLTVWSKELSCRS